MKIETKFDELRRDLCDFICKNQGKEVVIFISHEMADEVMYSRNLESFHIDLFYKKRLFGHNCETFNGKRFSKDYYIAS